jgi:hypothetical protein
MVKFSKKDIFVNNLKLHSEVFGKLSNPACVLIAPKMIGFLMSFIVKFTRKYPDFLIVQQVVA